MHFCVTLVFLSFPLSYCLEGFYNCFPLICVQFVLGKSIKQLQVVSIAHASVFYNDLEKKVFKISVDGVGRKIPCFTINCLMAVLKPSSAVRDTSFILRQEQVSLSWQVKEGR